MQINLRRAKPGDPGDKRLLGLKDKRLWLLVAGAVFVLGVAAGFEMLPWFSLGLAPPPDSAAVFPPTPDRVGLSRARKGSGLYGTIGGESVARGRTGGKGKRFDFAALMKIFGAGNRNPVAKRIVKTVKSDPALAKLWRQYERDGDKRKFIEALQTSPDFARLMKKLSKSKRPKLGSPKPFEKLASGMGQIPSGSSGASLNAAGSLGSPGALLAAMGRGRGDPSPGAASPGLSAGNSQGGPGARDKRVNARATGTPMTNMGGRPADVSRATSGNAATPGGLPRTGSGCAGPDCGATARISDGGAIRTASISGYVPSMMGGKGGAAAGLTQEEDAGLLDVVDEVPAVGPGRFAPDQEAGANFEEWDARIAQAQADINELRNRPPTVNVNQETNVNTGPTPCTGGDLACLESSLGRDGEPAAGEQEGGGEPTADEQALLREADMNDFQLGLINVGREHVAFLAATKGPGARETIKALENLNAIESRNGILITSTSDGGGSVSNTETFSRTPIEDFFKEFFNDTWTPPDPQPNAEQRQANWTSLDQTMRDIVDVARINVAAAVASGDPNESLMSGNLRMMEQALGVTVSVVADKKLYVAGETITGQSVSLEDYMGNHPVVGR